MDIKQLANLLGGTVNGQWLNIPGPGHGAGDRSLGLRFDPAAPNGFFVHSLAVDDPRTCRAYVKRLLTKVSAGLEDTLGTKSASPDHIERTRQALKLWKQASLPEGTLVERYLMARGCNFIATIPISIRFHARCRFGTERVPAMVALIQNILTDEPVGLHRTALNDDGSGKRQIAGGAKRMLGAAGGAAVKLQPHQGVLGIAEGIETALSAAQLFGVSTWALLSAGAIRNCPIIPGIKRLVIFADYDDAGLAAAEQCARRYSNNGISAAVRCPRAPNTDWNDELKEKA